MEFGSNLFISGESTPLQGSRAQGLAEEVQLRGWPYPVFGWILPNRFVLLPSARQSPDVGCLGKAYGPGRGDSLLLDVSMMLTAGGCYWSHSRAASSLMMPCLGSASLFLLEFLCHLFCRQKVSICEMYLAKVRWLFLTSSLFRNNMLSEAPYKQIYEQIRHFESLKTCIISDD